MTPPPKGKGELLTIIGDPVCKGYGMIEKIVYFSIFYFLCFVEEISMDMVEEQVMEETEPDLKGEEDFSTSNDREEHWKEVE